MKDFEKFLNKNYLIILIVILASFLYLYDLDAKTLNVDEAEIYLAATNIGEHGIPLGQYNDLTFYENAYLYKSKTNDTKYEFASTNYYNTNKILKKGWITYYLTAFASIFGNSEELLRLPFALIAILVVIVLFILTKEMFNRKTALITTLIFVLSPRILEYGRMIRYYSPMLLFTLLVALVFWRAYHRKDLKYYILSGICIGLLFHTNILTSFSLGISIGAYHIIITKRKTGFNEILAIAVSGLITLPWLFGTGFFWNIAREPISKINVIEFPMSTFINITSQGMLKPIMWLTFIVVIVMLVYNYRIKYNKNKKINKNINKNTKSNKKISNKTLVDRIKKFLDVEDTQKLYYVVFIFLGLIILPTILSPTSSYEKKLFISTIPFILMLIGFLFNKILDQIKNKYLSVIIVVLIVFVSIFNASAYMDGQDPLKIKEPYIDSDRIHYQELNLILNNWYENGTEIYNNENHFSTTFYTGKETQKIWPIKKSYLDANNKDFILIISEPIDSQCKFFFQYLNTDQYCENNKNYLDLIKNCEEQTLKDKTKVYFCKSKKQLEFNNYLGLSTNDFPKNNPPDFIWNQEPFPVKIELNHFGEEIISKVKIIYTGEFATEAFDKDQIEKEFIENVKGVKLENDGFVITSKLYDLGLLEYNRKLLNKQKLLNASIKICYPYKTSIRVEICKDRKEICNISNSAAPLIASNIQFDKLKLMFALDNKAEGIIGSYNECNSSTPSKQIKVQSTSFICEANKMNFECQGISDKIELSKVLNININYDYQQEFKKSIMIRSKEKNENDYQNYLKNK